MYHVLHHGESKCWLELLVCLEKVTRVGMMFYNRHLGHCAGTGDA